MVLCKIRDLEPADRVARDEILASRCLYLCSFLVFDQTIDNQFRSFVQYLKVSLNSGEQGNWSPRRRTVSHKPAELIVSVLPPCRWAWEQTSPSIPNIRWMSRKWRKFGNRGRKKQGRNCRTNWEFLHRIHRISSVWYQNNLVLISLGQDSWSMFCLIMTSVSKTEHTTTTS